MPLTRFDHVNVRTGNLDAMIEWYADVLGLVSGARPDFGFPGAWLYLGEDAVVHLVGLDRPPRAEDPALEHVAFAATGLREFVDRLEARGIAHTLDPVPGIAVVQLNLRDPDGNHLHIDFDAAEAEARTVA